MRHIVASFLILASYPSFAAFNCDWFFLKGNGQKSEQLENKVSSKSQNLKEITSLDELFDSFSSGLVPNLEDPEQLKAFELYRKMRFGNPDTNAGSIEKLSKILKKYPELTKTPFKNFEISMSSKSYPVTQSLRAFLNSHIKSSGQVRNNLFQIDANTGFWKKLLSYETPEEFLVETSDKAQKKALKKQAGDHFKEFFDEKFPKDLRSQIQDKKTDIKERAKLLYDYLTSLERTPEVAQAIVDLTHTIGYWDAGTQKLFKSSDGLDRLNAFRKILEDRDSFSMELGFSDHFDEVLSKFSIDKPTGVEFKDGLTSQIQKLEEEILKNATSSGEESKRVVRHLSIVESPFRSCLGGSDCSSRTYFDKALDPNFHYFTITDETGYSTGHITIVLGKAQNQKIAFIDKVQNVDNVDLPIMMEAVRQSVLEDDYILALPVDLGNHNGISNEATTRSFIERGIKTDSETLKGFSPHSHNYSFDNQYSRAYDKLAVRRVQELPSSGDLSVTAAQTDGPWKIKNIDLEKLARASYELKNGDLEDKLRYIPSMKVVKQAGLRVDSDFEKVLSSWVSDEEISFKLKKQVVTRRWLEEDVSLASLIQSFDEANKFNLIQNLVDTPKYKKKIISDKNLLLALAVEARASEKLSRELLELQGNSYTKTYLKVLSSKDINNKDVTQHLKFIREKFASGEVSDLLSVLKRFEGSSIEEAMKMEIAGEFIRGSGSDLALGRKLNHLLDDESREAQAITKLLFQEQIPFEFEGFETFKTYQDLYEFKEKSALSFDEAFEDWLQDESIASAQKARALRTTIGSGSDNFKDYIAIVPPSQQKEVVGALTEANSLDVFVKLAKKAGVEEALYRDAIIESFEFVNRGFPKKGQPVSFRMGDNLNTQVTLEKPFEMGMTQVTQLQWALVMGENPSRFVDEGKIYKINGKDIKVDANRPVEQVSWEDVQRFIQKLNDSQDKYTYSLPSEAQWEFAARAGNESKFSFGEDESLISEYGWYSGNSGNKTHPVASKKTNAFGLHDVHGNVWEWVQDWYGNSLPGGVDPRGPSTGSYRVIRGGSWYNSAEDLRSAYRYDYGPGGRSFLVGFRLSRTLR
jgi:hypothetical protein